MSRWDALKPTGNSSSTKQRLRGRGEGLRWNNDRKIAHQQHQQPRTFSSTKCDTHNNHNRNNNNEKGKEQWSSSLHKTRENTNPFPNRLGEHLVTREALLERYERLLSQLHQHEKDHTSSVDNKHPHHNQEQCEWLIQLAKCIQIHSSTHLSAVNLSEDVVDAWFLPFLQQYHLEHQAQPETSNKVVSHIVKTLQTLFPTPIRNSTSSSTKKGVGPHATRLLAPVVEEVSERGQERQRPNRIRLALLDVLQNLLRIRSDAFNASMQLTVAQCLIQVLDCAILLEGTHKHALGKGLDVDSGVLYQYFAHNFSKSDIVSSLKSTSKTWKGSTLEVSLQLLRTCVRRHPESSSQLLTLCLLPNHNHQSLTATMTKDNDSKHHHLSSLSCCLGSGGDKTRSVTIFLQVLHSQTTASKEIARLGVDMLEATTMLEQWLVPSNIHAPKKPSSMSTFGDRIAHGLELWCKVCACRLHKECRDDASVARLSATLLRRIPFSTIHQSTLFDCGTNLASAILKNVLSEKLSHSSKDVIEPLVKAIGGYETPLGDFVGMTSPMKRYLDTPQGMDQIKHMLNHTNDGSYGASLQIILTPIVRTHPQPFLVNAELWDLLSSHALGSIRDGNQDMAMLSAFLEGRKDLAREMPIESSTAVLDDVLPQMLSNLENSNLATSVLFPTLDSYGSLLPLDWDSLMNGADLSTANAHLQALLRLCDPNKSVKIRKIAFKTLGDVCTAYFSSNAAKESPASFEPNQNVCKVLLSGLGDDNVSAPSSSMALYAFGNLIRILKEREYQTMLLFEPIKLQECAIRLLTICRAQQNCEESFGSSADPKMVTNAIRTLSHLICLVFMDKGRNVNAYQSRGLNCNEILNHTFEVLSFSIHQPIRLALKEIGNQWSWKARSTVKKIGWGACHALSTILVQLDTCTNLLDSKCMGSMHACLLALLDCVAHLDKIHDKVGLVAMEVLCSVNLCTSRLGNSSTASLHQLTLGPSIVKCVHWISSERSGDTPGDVVESLPLKLKFQVGELLLNLLGCCSISDAEIILSSFSPNGLQLQFLYDWLSTALNQGKDSVKIQHAFTTIALAMTRRPDLISLVDTQLEQKFASQAKDLISTANLHGPDQDEDEL